MGKRDFLFLGLVVGGLVWLGAALMPPREPKPRTRYDAAAYQDPSLVAVAKAVDDSFAKIHHERTLVRAGRADDLAVARRIALGLMGTIPSLEEIRQFEWLPEGERLPWYIDHVLQDRRSADYLAERLARAVVGTEDGPFILFRRRRLVGRLAEMFAKNERYDHMVRDLVTAQGVWTNKPETNFVTVTVKPDSDNQPEPVRLAGRVTRAFLGLRLDCAECHDHPFASWKQTDFHRLAAWFGQTHVGFRGVYDGDGEFKASRRPGGEKKVIEPGVPFGEDFLPEDGSRRERLAAWVTHERNPYFAKAAVTRFWAVLVGRPLSEQADNLESETPPPPALQILADDFVANGYDVRRLLRVMVMTETFRRDSASDADAGPTEESVYAVFPLTRLRPEQVFGGLVQASSVTTIDTKSHVLTRVIRAANQGDFLQRYGDHGEDEFADKGGTIPQRLMMMNGELIRERFKEDLFSASTRIAVQAPDDARAVEAAYLAALTRRPTAEESAHFESRLKDTQKSRAQHLEDLFWALLNSTEFSWNH